MLQMKHAGRASKASRLPFRAASPLLPVVAGRHHPGLQRGLLWAALMVYRRHQKSMPLFTAVKQPP